MPKVTLYHNPKCAKSRQTLQLIREQGIEPEIVEYLKQPLNKTQLKKLLSLLQMTASDLVRRKEALYKALDLSTASQTQLQEAMVNNPLLIERPIVVSGNKACLGRPPETVLEIL